LANQLKDVFRLRQVTKHQAIVLFFSADLPAPAENQPSHYDGSAMALDFVFKHSHILPSTMSRLIWI